MPAYRRTMVVTSPARTDRAAIDAAAGRLWEAQAKATPCTPVRDLIEAGDIGGAYAAQQVNTARHLAGGRRPIGWKVGLTSLAVQSQLGVDQPDFGILFADTEVLDDLAVDPGTLLQPRVEAEVAFVLGADLTGEPVTVVDVIRATAFVLPAIEIVASRVQGWDITIVDTIADNASAGAYVVGTRPVPLSSIDLRRLGMEMSGPDGVVSSGSSAACLGNPVNAVVWLSNTLQRLGSPLQAGDLVLSGALGPMVTVQMGAVYEATISSLGSVRARFGQA
jgi:2-keto-4-pentenoate hydratase